MFHRELMIRKPEHGIYLAEIRLKKGKLKEKIKVLDSKGRFCFIKEK